MMILSFNTRANASSKTSVCSAFVLIVSIFAITSRVSFCTDSGGPEEDTSRRGPNSTLEPSGPIFRISFEWRGRGREGRVSIFATISRESFALTRAALSGQFQDMVLIPP